MHDEALDWVAKHATDQLVAVLDIGGRDVGGDWGGSPRSLFPNATAYQVLDIEAGPDVHIVADAATWVPSSACFDVVVCMEVFEHTDRWPQICRTAFAALRPGGRLITTMAGPGRPVHGALGGLELGPGEHYANIRPERLRAVLEQTGFTDVTVDVQPAPSDVRAVATKPEE